MKLITLILSILFTINAAIADETDVTGLVSKIDRIAKSSGYKGYAPIAVPMMIYKTQRDGGLENYLGKVIGCNQLETSVCDQLYPKTTALQILDDAVLYQVSDYSGGEYVDFTIMVIRESGKLYQEGQRLRADVMYVFLDMFTYETALGSMKTVPLFLPVDLYWVSISESDQNQLPKCDSSNAKFLFVDTIADTLRKYTTQYRSLTNIEELSFDHDTGRACVATLTTTKEQAEYRYTMTWDEKIDKKYNIKIKSKNNW